MLLENVFIISKNHDHSSESRKSDVDRRGGGRAKTARVSGTSAWLCHNFRNWIL